jgi:hypothetical protein
MWFKPCADRDLYYHSAAAQIINEIRMSDRSFPITKGATRQHAMAMLKDELGNL